MSRGSGPGEGFTTGFVRLVFVFLTQSYWDRFVKITRIIYGLDLIFYVSQRGECSLIFLIKKKRQEKKKEEKNLNIILISGEGFWDCF